MLAGAGQLADCITTHAAIRKYGNEAEANPVIRGVLDVAGTPGLYGLKLGVVWYTYREALAYDRGSVARERRFVSLAIFGGIPAFNNAVLLLAE